nr:sugar ABC transporter substrate-binding protein [Marinicella sp. W31]MDC2879161.1 sugar ABC transporter substrate-binding protein [Marinicella sp. W31]
MLNKLLLSAVFGLGVVAAPGLATAQVNLTFASWQFQEPGNADWWNAVIDAFEEENPDISIEEIYIPFADYLPQMTIRFASGRAPAVMQLNEQLFGSFAAQGWLAPLDDRIEGTDIATDWAAPQKALTWDGATRGVLLSNNAYQFFYNKDMLAGAGLPVPDSWESFKETAAEMTDRDAGIFGLSAVTTEHPTAVEDVHRYAIWAGANLIEDGQYNLTSPEVIDAMNAYRETVGQNAPLGNNSSVARQLFIDGRTSMLIDGPWVWSWLERATPEMRPKLVMGRLPFDPQLAPGGLIMNISEGLDEEVEDAAWKFIAFANSEEWQREYLLTTGQPPGRAANVLTPEDEEAHPNLAIASASALDAVPLFPKEQPIQMNFTEYSSVLMEAALRLLSTKDPTEDIMADAQGQLERAIPLN